MSLIKPLPSDKKSALRVKLKSDTLDEINLYCTYAGFKNPDAFLEASASHILSKDKKFNDWKKSKS